MTSPETLPDDIAALQTALTAERAARQQAEARASGAEAMVAHLKLLIAKMKRERFGQSAERGRKLLDQLQLQLKELEASAPEDEVTAGTAEPDPRTVRGSTHKKPVRGPLPAHLPRERVVVPAPSSCTGCGGRLVKLGEGVTETLEEARYEASLAARRYEVVDPTKRLVARELETRWNTALERVAHVEDRIARHDDAAALRPKVDRAALMALARDLPAAWNAPRTDARTKQRITHILIREVVLDRDDNEAIFTIHWNGGRHTELRVSRVRTGRYPADRHPSPVTAIRTLGGQLPDRELAVTLNRMRCKPVDGKAWTTVRVRELRQRLGIDAFDPALPRAETIRADATATRIGICIGSVHKLIRNGVLPAAQLMPSAPWQIPVAALDTEAVRTGIREIVSRRPKFYKRFQEDKTLRLPGF